MQRFVQTFLFVALTGVCGLAWSAPGVYATYTINVATIKMKDAFQGCTTGTPLLPTSSVSTYYDDHTLVINNIVNGNPYDQYGTWGELDSSFSKIRTDFTGSMADGGGTWAGMLLDFASVAVASCGAFVDADGATFRVTRQDTTFKITQGTCSGTGTSSFAMEGYGTNTGTGLPIKMTRQVTTSGTVVIDPSHCP